ncbi:MAG: hypothetical protein IKM61_10360 [Eubacteriaceae bacterium]|nr:hypothetical protein [Eubacteriaceae bacterium]
MRKMSATEKKVIALAYFHRYGWIATIMICIAIWTEYMMHILGAGSILYSIWSFVGYKLKWKHIFCSYQNAHYKRMTPDSIRWNQIKKGDAYGVPLIFFIMGFALLTLMMVN